MACAPPSYRHPALTRGGNMWKPILTAVLAVSVSIACAKSDFAPVDPTAQREVSSSALLSKGNQLPTCSGSSDCAAGPVVCTGEDGTASVGPTVLTDYSERRIERRPRTVRPRHRRSARERRAVSRDTRPGPQQERQESAHVHREPEQSRCGRRRCSAGDHHRWEQHQHRDPVVHRQQRASEPAQHRDRRRP